MTEEYLPPLAMVLPVASGQIGPNYGDYGQSVDILRKARIEIGLGPQGQLYPSMTSGGRYPVDIAGQTIATSISGNQVLTSVSGNIIQQANYGSPVYDVLSGTVAGIGTTSGTAFPAHALSKGFVVVTANGPQASMPMWVYLSGAVVASGIGIGQLNQSSITLEGISNTNLVKVAALISGATASIYGA